MIDSSGSAGRAPLERSRSSVTGLPDGFAREQLVELLLHEDIRDRRWARHQDQLLTAVGIAAIILAVALHLPGLGAAATLLAAPRAFRWRFGVRRGIERLDS